jgi:micrococcal nuclease
MILCLSLLPSMALAQGKYEKGVIYDATVTRVIDGDTVVFAAPFLPAPLKKELSLRILGVDTPESGGRAQCAQERQRGKDASDFTRRKIAAASRVQISLVGWDKYGGRVLGDVIVDGASLRLLLLQEGHAREYRGSAKTSWCK